VHAHGRDEGIAGWRFSQNRTFYSRRTILRGVSWVDTDSICCPVQRPRARRPWHLLRQLRRPGPRQHGIIPAPVPGDQAPRPRTPLASTHPCSGRPVPGHHRAAWARGRPARRRAPRPEIPRRPGPSVAVRGKPTVHADRPHSPDPVRHTSVDTATQRPTARQDDTPRDKQNGPPSARIRSR
jgi:hypothetical protein